MSSAIAAVKTTNGPEFLNRIDEIIIFDRLDDRQITRIVDIQLRPLVERLATVDRAVTEAYLTTRDLCLDEWFHVVLL